MPEKELLSAIAVGGLLLFAVYRRIRRNFGRQRLQPARMILRIIILVLVGSLSMLAALHSPASLGAAAAGLLVGLALAFWGSAQTRFEREGDTLFYVPHTYTGLAVTALFVARLGYRLLTGSFGAGSAGADNAQAAAMALRSPLTSALLWVLVGYYVCYYSLVLLKSRSERTITGFTGAPTSGEASKPG
jgi:hypothetical protein